MAKTDSKLSIWMPWMIGDARRDTLGMGPEFKGIYMDLMMAMWENDGQLKDDEDYLQSICAVTKACWVRHRENMYCLFYPCEGMLMHNGLREALAKAKAVAKTNAAKTKAATEARMRKAGK